MDKDAFKKFDELSTSLLEHVAELSPRIPEIVNEVKESRDESLKILMDAKKQCVSNEAKEIYDLPCKKLVQISERVVELNLTVA